MSEQSNQIRDAIAQAIGDNPVILFMKGTPEQPPPRTPTRRPAVSLSPCELRNSRTFAAPVSVRATPLAW